MEIGYNVWLYGCNESIACDSNSEVALSALPAAGQTVSEPNWVKCYVLKLEPIEDELGEAKSRHGIITGSRSMKINYSMEFYPFIFPDEMSKREAVYSVFRKRNKFLCIDGSNQPAGDKYTYQLHSAGNCIQIECTGRDQSTKGNSKKLTLKLQKKKPVIE